MRRSNVIFINSLNFPFMRKVRDLMGRNKKQPGNVDAAIIRKREKTLVNNHLRIAGEQNGFN